jgi:hypothetical protein
VTQANAHIISIQRQNTSSDLKKTVVKMWKRFICIVLYASAVSCSQEKEEIQFYFTRNYAGDKWENHRTGLLWTLSYLGATLPQGSLDKSITWKDSSTFLLNFSKLGFSENALQDLGIICDSLQNTEHYRIKHAADLGAFVAMTIGCSNHYYEITNAPSTLEEFLKRQDGGTLKTFNITRSAVARHHRVIKYPPRSSDPLRWVFVAGEGNGSVTEKKFVPDFFEVFDIMPNGQLRFMIYDKTGKLVSASPKALGEAGKPGKCLWCHEIVIQPLFEKTDSTENSVTPSEFQSDVVFFMQALNEYRKGLKSDLDFSKTQDHTQMELEYIGYMQPSVKKLAVEWNLPESEVERLLKTVKSVPHEEFKFLGKVFDRNETGGPRTLFPGSVREPGRTEPDFFIHP